VLLGGSAFGSACHWQPVVPRTKSRSAPHGHSYPGRPPRLAHGSSAQSASIPPRSNRSDSAPPSIGCSRMLPIPSIEQLLGAAPIPAPARQENSEQNGYCSQADRKRAPFCSDDDPLRAASGQELQKFLTHTRFAMINQSASSLPALLTVPTPAEAAAPNRGCQPACHNPFARAVRAMRGSLQKSVPLSSALLLAWLVRTSLYRTA